MFYDNDIPSEWTDSLVYDDQQDKFETIPHDLPKKPDVFKDIPENAFVEQDIFLPSFRDLERTSIDLGGLVAGPGAYAKNLEKLNMLSASPLQKALARASLAAQSFYEIKDSNSITTIVQKYHQPEYLNMVALVGSILFYHEYIQKGVNQKIKKEDIKKFYEKNKNIKPEIQQEDLLRYIRLTIETLGRHQK